MSNALSQINQDPRYLDQKRKEMQPYLDLFSKQLSSLYQRMPHLGITVDMNTGEIEARIDPQGQELIDRLIINQQKTLERTFPELFPNKIKSPNKQ